MRSCKLLLINLFIAFLSLELSAQCTTDFKVHEIEYTDGQLGKIEVSVINGGFSDRYTAKVYQINSEVDLISEVRPNIVNNLFAINQLQPNTYWIKMEWGDGCFKTIGGLEGIKVGPNLEKP